MAEYNFKEKIEDLLQQHRRTKKSLYDTLGMSMQGFDSMMKNNSFTAVRIGEIAKFFEIHVSELYGENASGITNEALTTRSDQYLQEHLATLEQNFEKLLEQLNVKDTQIAGLQESQKNLQRMLEHVLGKSRGVAFTQLSEEEAFKLTLDMYTAVGLKKGLSALPNQSHLFDMPSPAKSAALR